MDGFINNCMKNSGLGILYIIECFWTDIDYNFNENHPNFYGDCESFYKFGITSKDCVEKRFPSRRALPYEMDIIYKLK